jgi:hypothetical protein
MFIIKSEPNNKSVFQPGYFQAFEDQKSFRVNAPREDATEFKTYKDAEAMIEILGGLGAGHFTAQVKAKRTQNVVPMFRMVE